MKMVGFLVGALCVAAVTAQVKITIDHNPSAFATSAFKFKRVPSPAKDDAAIFNYSSLDSDPEVDFDPEEVLGAGKVVDAVPPFINAATLLESSLLSIT